MPMTALSSVASSNATSSTGAAEPLGVRRPALPVSIHAVVNATVHMPPALGGDCSGRGLEQRVERVADWGRERAARAKARSGAGGCAPDTPVRRPQERRYDRYAVDLTQLQGPVNGPVPGSNGLICRDGLQYIQISHTAAAAPRYYRVERSGAGVASVVHPEEPYAHVQIPVHYDRVLGRWNVPEQLGLAGGGWFDRLRHEPFQKLDVWAHQFPKKIVPDSELFKALKRSAASDIKAWLARADYVYWAFGAQDGAASPAMFPSFLLEPDELWWARLRHVARLDLRLPYLDDRNYFIRGSARTQRFRIGNWSGLRQLFLERARDVQKLTLGKRMQSLEELSVQNLGQLQTLKFAEPLTGLRRLELAGNPQLTAVVGLSNAENLERVRIENNLALKDILEKLAQRPSLTSLICLNHAEPTLPDLSGLTRLHELRLTIPKGASLPSLEKMAHLKRLALTGPQLPPTWPTLHSDVRLTELTMGGPMPGLLPPANMAMLTTLVRGGFASRTKPLANLDGLERASQLQRLILKMIVFEADTLALTQHLPELQTASIQHCGLTDVYIGKPVDEFDTGPTLLTKLWQVDLQNNPVRRLSLTNVPTLSEVMLSYPYPDQIILAGRHGSSAPLAIRFARAANGRGAAVLPHHNARHRWLTIAEPSTDERVHYIIDLRRNSLTSIPQTLMNDESMVGIEFRVAANALDRATRNALASRPVTRWPRFDLTENAGDVNLGMLLQENALVDDSTMRQARINWAFLQKIGNTREPAAGIAAVEEFRQHATPDGGLRLISDYGYLDPIEIGNLKAHGEKLRQRLPLEAPLFQYRTTLEQDSLGNLLGARAVGTWNVAYEAFGDPDRFQTSEQIAAWLDKQFPAHREMREESLTSVLKSEQFLQWAGELLAWRQSSGDAKGLMENWRKAAMQWRRAFNEDVGSVVALLAKSHELPEMNVGQKDAVVADIAMMLGELVERPDLFKILREEGVATESSCEDRVLGEINQLHAALRRWRYASGPSSDTTRLFEAIRGTRRWYALNQWVQDLLASKGLDDHESIEVLLYLAGDLAEDLGLPVMSKAMHYEAFAKRQLWLCYAGELGIRKGFHDGSDNDMQRIRQHALEQARRVVLDTETAEDIVQQLTEDGAWRAHLDLIRGRETEAESGDVDAAMRKYRDHTERLLDELGLMYAAG